MQGEPNCEAGAVLHSCIVWPPFPFSWTNNFQLFILITCWGHSHWSSWAIVGWRDCSGSSGSPASPCKGRPHRGSPETCLPANTLAAWNVQAHFTKAAVEKKPVEGQGHVFQLLPCSPGASLLPQLLLRFIRDHHFSADQGITCNGLTYREVKIAQRVKCLSLNYLSPVCLASGGHYCCWPVATTGPSHTISQWFFLNSYFTFDTKHRNEKFCKDTKWETSRIFPLESWRCLPARYRQFLPNITSQHSWLAIVVLCRASCQFCTLSCIGLSCFPRLTRLLVRLPECAGKPTKWLHCNALQ